MESIDQRVKLHNKPFDEMELEELYAEKMARKWHRYKVINAKNKLSMKKHWLEENKPIEPIEEIRQKYEDGDYSASQYRVALMHHKNATTYRMRIDDYTEYANRIVFDEESTVAYIDELIAQREAEKASKKKKKRPNNAKKYDPRKRVSKYNQHPLEPRRKWATKTEDKPMPRLQHAKARWKRGKEDDKPLTVMKRMQPIITWDIETLMSVARDRGFFTEMAVTATIAENLKTTIHGASALLKSGKLSWGQCMVIGAVFEMTPKEFCDVFMSGYFVEVADGVFRAKVDDIDNLLDAPYKAKPMITEEGDDEVGV